MVNVVFETKEAEDSKHSEADASRLGNSRLARGSGVLVIGCERKEDWEIDNTVVVEVSLAPATFTSKPDSQGQEELVNEFEPSPTSAACHLESLAARDFPIWGIKTMFVLLHMKTGWNRVFRNSYASTDAFVYLARYHLRMFGF